MDEPIIIDGQTVLTIDEAAAELGITAEEVRRHGQDPSFPRVCRPPGSFVGVKPGDIAVWRRMLAPVKVEQQALVRSGSLIDGVFVEDVGSDG